MNYGKFTIDGLNSFENYGVFVSDDGYNDILSYPELKEADQTDFPERDGVEIDLSTPELSNHQFQLSFYSIDYNLTEEFLAALKSKVYHDFTFEEIGKTLNLRLVQNSTRTIHKVMESFKLTFSEDTPLNGYVRTDPVAALTASQSGYEIDGTPLSNYGIYVLDSTSLFKTPSIKMNLAVDISNESGIDYDSEGAVVFNTKVVSLKCFAMFQSATAMTNNLNALVYDLLQTTQKTDSSDGTVYSDAIHGLYVEETGNTYEAYYNSLDVSRFEAFPNNSVWIEFTLNMTLRAATIEGIDYILSTEDGYYITTEDGEFYINLNHYVE